MNGKGDKNRTTNRRGYRHNYDAINWRRQPPADQFSQALARQERNWWREHERIRTENQARAQMFSAHGISTNQ